MYDLEKVSTQLKSKLNPSRYRHSHGVMYTAANLAFVHGGNVQEAMAAGLLHDCGKIGDFKTQFTLAKELGIEITKKDKEIGSLFHAKLGMVLAKRKYGIMDEAILEAIRYHATGRPNMSLLEKIIFVADFIEPWRAEGAWLKPLRKIAFQDLEKAVVYGAQETIKYLEQNQQIIDEQTRETLEFYKKENRT